jgi:antitoxin (DNA-binding transcriptional repressor) of toxin-antitoxin stability system
MKTAPVAEVKAKLSEFLQQCQREPVIITQEGRVTAMLVAVTEDEDLERLVLAHTPRFRDMLEQAEARIRESGGVKHEDFWAALESRRKKGTRSTSRRIKSSKSSR